MIAAASTVSGLGTLVIFGLWILIFGGIGYACGAGRGRGAAGAVLGLLLGPLGMLIALFLPANRPRVFCASRPRVRALRRKIYGNRD